jgi:hypothetical protein
MVMASTGVGCSGCERLPKMEMAAVVARTVEVATGGRRLKSCESDKAAAAPAGNIGPTSASSLQAHSMHFEARMQHGGVSSSAA